ncbi:MAG: hypothetical protein WC332_05580, partial [Clostridia bacterium]
VQRRKGNYKETIAGVLQAGYICYGYDNAEIEERIMNEEKEQIKGKVIKTVIIGVIILAISALLIYWYFFR